MSDLGTIYRGCTFERAMNYTDSEGEPVPLTGDEISFELRYNRQSVRPDLILATDAEANDNGSSVTWEDQDGGEWFVKLTDEETAQLNIGTAYWVVKRKEADGDAIRLAGGTVEIDNA